MTLLIVQYHFISSFLKKLEGSIDGWALLPQFCSETLERESVILYEELNAKWFIEECHPLKPSDFGVSKKSVFKEVSITEIQLLLVNERPITEVIKTFNMSLGTGFQCRKKIMFCQQVSVTFRISCFDIPGARKM